MASPAEILRIALVDLGLVTLPGVEGQTLPYQQLPGDGTTLCFVSAMPNEPDQVVALYDMHGLIFGREMKEGKYQQHNGVLVKIRSLDYGLGYALANNIALALGTLHAKAITVDEEDVVIDNVYKTTTVVPLGEEVGTRRQLWTINARISFSDAEPSLG